MPTAAVTTPWLTANEAAEYLRSTPGTLAQLRYHGNGPKSYRAGRKVLYKRADLDAYVTESTR